MSVKIKLDLEASSLSAAEISELVEKLRRLGEQERVVWTTIRTLHSERTSMEVIAQDRSEPTIMTQGEPPQLPEKYDAPPQFPEIHHALSVFNLLTILLPKRMCDEEIGDALEDIAKRHRAGCPRSHIYMKAWATVFWLLLHAIGEVVSRVLGKKSAGK